VLQIHCVCSVMVWLRLTDYEKENGESQEEEQQSTTKGKEQG
jgi:hypothetical protein